MSINSRTTATSKFFDTQAFCMNLNAWPARAVSSRLFFEAHFSRIRRRDNDGLVRRHYGDLSLFQSLQAVAIASNVIG
jgi:hypothetical protein